VIEPLGSNLLITAVVGANTGDGERAPQRVKIQTHIDFPVRADQPLWLRPEPGKLRWFDAESGREVATI
jgi:multiple sugar transport system ATP-binding protein